jgi:hypothetical protein
MFVLACIYAAIRCAAAGAFSNGLLGFIWVVARDAKRTNPHVMTGKDLLDRGGGGHKEQAKALLRDLHSHSAHENSLSMMK